MIAVGVIGGLIVVIISGLRNQERIIREWEMALSPWGAEVYRELGERVAHETRMAEYAYRRAFTARDKGSVDEAIRLLDVGMRVVERTSPDMITLLAGMAVVSRMATAVAKVSPLQPWAFNLRRLSGVALVGAIGHHLLVSTAERFRLRVFLLRRGFLIVTQFLFSTASRLRSRHVHGDEWDRIAAARNDLRTLSDESLHTFHALLLSLSAEHR